MKKIAITSALMIAVLSTFAQNTNSDKIIIRHDTTILNTVECQWLVNNSTAKNKSVSWLILEAVKAGKIKAYDPQTGESIPADKIFAWRQSVDTTMVWDPAKDKNVIKIIQNKINPEFLSRIRVYHDWYLDVTTGRLESRVKMFELMAEVRSTYSDDIRGYRPLYQIRY